MLYESQEDQRGDRDGDDLEPVLERLNEGDPLHAATGDTEGHDAAEHDDARTQLLVPDQGDGQSALALLERGMSPPHFPITPSQLRGSWSFDTIERGERATVVRMLRLAGRRKLRLARRRRQGE